jgi:hypothetical protein
MQIALGFWAFECLSDGPGPICTQFRYACSCPRPYTLLSRSHPDSRVRARARVRGCRGGSLGAVRPPDLGFSQPGFADLQELLHERMHRPGFLLGFTRCRRERGARAFLFGRALHRR